MDAAEQPKISSRGERGGRVTASTCIVSADVLGERDCREPSSDLFTGDVTFSRGSRRSRTTSSKDALASQLSCLQTTLDQRQSLLTQWDYVSHQQSQGEQLFPVARQAALREEYRQAQQERSTLTNQLEAVSQSLQLREQDLHCQGARLRDCEQALGALTQRIAVAQRDVEHAVTFIQEREEEFPSDWRQPAAELSQKSIKL